MTPNEARSFVLYATFEANAVDPNHTEVDKPEAVAELQLAGAKTPNLPPNLKSFIRVVTVANESFWPLIVVSS